MIVSARSDLPTKLRGFGLGASDYLAKPFALDELRRAAPSPAAATRGKRDENLVSAPARSRSTSPVARRTSASSWPTSRIASSGSSTISSSTQATIVSRERLLSEVWGYHFDPGSNVVEVCVRRLRKKLGADAPIETVRHAGYRLRAA